MGGLMEIYKPMKKARSELLIKHHFFGKLVMHLELVETDQVDTMATDGSKIYYNKNFVDTLTHQEIVGIQVHEVLHVVFKHHLRRGNRDKHYWNVAGDFCINAVAKEGGFTLPDDALFNPDYAGMSTEKIYSLIFNDAELKEQHANISCAGEVIDAVNKETGKELTDIEIKELEKEINIQVIQAEQSAKSIGKGGDAYKSMINIVKTQSVAWNEVLCDLVVSQHSTSDYNFNKANRRFIYQNMYLPSVEHEPLLNLAWGWDISGSVDEEETAIYTDIINTVNATLNVGKNYIIYCDYAVRKVDVFEQGEEVELEYYRGGGTDFEPVFKYIDKELNNEIDSLVYLTDGCGYTDKRYEPDYPVFWATTGTSSNFKFGEIVEVD